MTGDLAPLLGGLGFFTLVGFIFWIVVDGRRRREHLKIATEFNNRLLERMGSVGEFSQFLQTEGGARFLNTLSTERGAIGPRDRILRAVHVGVILAVLGIGLATVGFMIGPTDEGAFTVLGVIVLSLGVGYLLSSAASYRLARSLGVLEEQGVAKSARN
jgi:hypothetical protein